MDYPFGKHLSPYTCIFSIIERVIVRHIIDFPLLVFILSFIIMSSFMLVIHKKFNKEGSLQSGFRETFNLIQGSSLSLLALLIGFSFSIAVGNFESRAKQKEAEIDAINTTYKRFDFLPDNIKAEAKTQLRNYLKVRLEFYNSNNLAEQKGINESSYQKGNNLWLLVSPIIKSEQTAVMNSISTSITDVLNSSVNTESAWSNRIPLPAWFFLLFLSTGCCILIGYGSQHTSKGVMLSIIFPLIISFSFMLIADIDSTQSGFINISSSELADTLTYLENTPSK